MSSESFALTPGVPLVDVRRGPSIESVHNGSFVVIDASGAVLHAVGSVHTPTFPRSSNKPMQALAMVRSGLNSPDSDLALACASHSGEPAHVEGALAQLERAGLDESALQCPPDWPLDESSRESAIADGASRRRIYMNCSGKHASMLLTCVLAGWPTDTYLDPTHPLQVETRRVIEGLSGEQVAATAVDGCGAPVMAISLVGLARSFSRLVQAEPGTHERKIADAMREFPFYVAGTGREDTDLMQAVPGLLMKGGAEGVHAFALADGTACALKLDDGATRPRVPLLLAALRFLGVPEASLIGVRPEQILGGGQPVGSISVRPDVFPSAVFSSR